MMQQSIITNDLSMGKRLWRALVKLDFISKFFAWLMEFLARVTEPMATFAIVYVIICAGVPVVMNLPLYTISLALIIGSPELLLVGAIKIAARELGQGNKKAWWLMTSCFILLALTALTVSDLFMWHWSPAAVNVLMGFRCLAGIGYTLARGICTDNEEEEELTVKPGSQVNLLLEQLTVNVTTSVQDTVNLTLQRALQEVNQVNQSTLTEVNRIIQVVNQHHQQVLALVNGVNQGVQADLQATIEVLGQQSQHLLEAAIARMEQAQGRRLEAVYTELKQVKVTLESNPVLPAVNGPGSPLALPSRGRTQSEHREERSLSTSSRVHSSAANPGDSEPEGLLEGTKVNQGRQFAVNYYQVNQVMPPLPLIISAVACSKALASKARKRAAQELGINEE